MSEKIQRFRGGILALVAGAIAAAAVIANFIRTGKVLWGGVVIFVLAILAWQARGRGVDRQPER